MMPARRQEGPNVNHNSGCQLGSGTIGDSAERPLSDEPGELAGNREQQRRQEDRAWVPVIVKRTDQSVRHPDDVLVSAIAEGLEQLNRPVLSLGLSSIAAGLILGFTAMAVGIGTVAVAPLDE
jgi:hypothetical protein